MEILLLLGALAAILYFVRQKANPQTASSPAGQAGSQTTDIPVSKSELPITGVLTPELLAGIPEETISAIKAAAPLELSVGSVLMRYAGTRSDMVQLSWVNPGDMAEMIARGYVPV